MPSLIHERRLLAAELLTPNAADNNNQQHETQQQPEEGAAVTTNNNTAAQDNAENGAAVRGDGCAMDLERFCSRDANILTLLENAPTEIDAAQVARAMKSVQLCMAKNVESLSAVCIEALVADLVSQKSTDTGVRTADALQPTTYQSVPDSNNNNQYNRNAPDDEDSSVEVSIHYSKHHNTAGALRGAHPALTAMAPAIVQAKQPASSSGDMDIASPLMWLLVFPFFCIGLYVTYNHALVYVRRRKDALRIESKQYMPLP